MSIFVTESFSDTMYDQFSKAILDQYYKDLKDLRNDKSDPSEFSYTSKLVELLDQIEYEIIKLKLNVLEAQHDLLPGVPALHKQNEERLVKEKIHKGYFITQFSVSEEY